MKSFFLEFSLLSSEEVQLASTEGAIVLDTNVLLNAYRYQSATRDEFFRVLEELKDRLWIPHHVALEFYRNRFAVIIEQKKQIKAVEKVITENVSRLESDLGEMKLETRHSSVRPGEFLTELNTASKRFLETLAELDRKQPGPNDTDGIKDRIESLFSGRIGAPPPNQDVVDKWYKEAAKRFEYEVPPGYKDAGKGKGKEGLSVYMHGGIYYQGRYGDFVVWQQILEMAKRSGWKRLVFVTSDSKEDWWHKEQCNGDVTFGPRVELREEARRLAGMESLVMYKSHTFLQEAGKALREKPTAAAIQEMKDVAQAVGQVAFNSSKPNVSQFDGAVLYWLGREHPNEKVEYSIWPEVEVVNGDGETTAYHAVGEWSKDAVTKGVQAFYELISAGKYKRVVLVYYVDAAAKMSQVMYHMKRRPALSIEDERVSIVVGMMVSSAGTWSFIPILTAERGRTSLSS